MSETWCKTLEILKARVEPEPFERWFAPLEVIKADGASLLLGAPDEFSVKWIKDNYLEIIKDALWDTVQAPVTVNLEAPHTRPQSNTPHENAATANRQTAPTHEADTPFLRFTFEQFVVAPSNEIAHSASELVAKAPGRQYNPLFIHGGVGVGKTHLLHAIWHQIRANQPHLQVLYTFGESYVNEVMTASRNGRLDLLRHKYRGQCDVLLMDDLQYLTTKDFPQEEFFHTFNELYNCGKQIVIVSDQPPQMLAGISERLRSRFQWGLQVDIAPPEFELCVQILLRKAQRENIDLPKEVAEYLAQRFKSSIRELEGALNKVSAHAKIRKIPITIELARHLMNNVVPANGHNQDTVIKVVADHFGLSVSDLKSSRRHQSVSLPRQIAMHILREHCGLSLPAIGALFGGRTHTTVMASISRVKDLVDTELATERLLRDIERRLGFA